MSKKIGIAFAVFAILAGLLFALKQREASRNKPHSFEFPVVADATKLEIQRDGETIVFEGSGASWRMTAPKAFPASKTAVEDIRKLLSEKRIVDMQRELSDGSGAVGIGATATPKPITFTVTGASGTHRFEVGRSVPVTQTGRTLTWVRPDGSDLVYRVGADFRGALDKPANEFREKQLTDFDGDKLTTIAFAGPGGSLKLKKEGSDWKVDGDGPEVDTTLVGRVVTSLAKLRAADFADDVTAEAAGLGPTAPSVTLGDGANTVTVRLGSEAPKKDPSDTTRSFYVARDGLDAVFVLAEFQAKRIGSEIGDFRPRKVLDITEADVASLAFEDAAGKVRFEPVSKPAEGSGEPPKVSWIVTQPERINEPNSSMVDRVVRNLTLIDAARFPSNVDDATAGLVTPRRIFTITTRDGKVRTLRLGNHVTAPSKPDGESSRYARLDDGAVFELSQYKVESLLKGVADFRPSGDASE